jgi:hypothetical protein
LVARENGIVAGVGALAMKNSRASLASYLTKPANQIYGIVGVK